MSAVSRVVLVLIFGLTASACTSVLADERLDPADPADPADPGDVQEGIAEGAPDAGLTSFPTAYMKCGGTLYDSRSVFTDDTSLNAVYSAPWKAETPGLGLYLGTQHITNAGGYKVSHTFSTPGTGPSTISYGYRLMRNAGKAAIYWDGQYFTTISLYAPDNVYRCELVLGDMDPGVHTLMVKVLNQKDPASGGTYVNLDYFRQYDHDNLAFNPIPVGYPSPLASYTSPYDNIWGPLEGTYGATPRWTSWNSLNAQDWYAVDFGSSQTFSKVTAHFYNDNAGVKPPTSYKIQYWNGTSWVDAANQVKSPASPVAGPNTVTFTPVTASHVRILCTNENPVGYGVYSGLTEFEVFN